MIAEASRKEAGDFDRRWEAAAKIIDHDPPLYTLGGYGNADAFYREVMQEEPRNARRYVRVAKYASPDEEARYGTSKLDAALGLIEAKLGHPLEHPSGRVREAARSGQRSRRRPRRPRSRRRSRRSIRSRTCASTRAAASFRSPACRSPRFITSFASAKTKKR